ncbi:MAG: four helix bundle protein [Patescibacteria group bacterium]|jgi:hypothetical protein
MVGQHERLKIWQKSYDLARDLIVITERFPRPQQMNGLGSEIRQAALNLIQTVMIANSGPGTAANHDLDLGIDYLQVIMRLARDLRYVSIGQYELLAEKIVELGKMNNGWMKAKRA